MLFDHMMFDHMMFDHMMFDHMMFDHMLFDHMLFDHMLPAHVRMMLFDTPPCCPLPPPSPLHPRGFGRSSPTPDM